MKRKYNSALFSGSVSRVVMTLLASCLVAAMAYWQLPVLAFGWSGVMFLLLVPIVTVSYFVWDIENKWPLRVAGIWVAVIVVFNVLSSPMLRSDVYQSLLGTPEEGQHNLPALDIRKAPLVSESMAHQAAQKLLSNEAGLGSQVVVGRMEKQVVNGKLVWVGFLEHTSFWRWFSNSVTPGYVIVSAYNSSEAKLVTGLSMRYLESGEFGDYIERLAWKAQPTKGLTDFTPEIDDEGRPYWVASVFERAIAFGPAQVVGTLVIDVQTGKADEYSIKETPAWVDRIQPGGVVASQVWRWGTLVHGFWNTWFANKDIIRPSSNPDLVYGENDRAYWYIGLASNGRDNGVNGFLMIDSRTKHAVHYKIVGANESVASEAVRGLMPEKHYSTSNPLPFLVDNEPTYVMTLMDNTGIPRGYGLVSIQNFQVVAAGETLEAAARLYSAKLSRQDNVISQNVTVVTHEGKVSRIAQDTRNGNSMYFLRISGLDKTFVGSSDLSEKLPITSVGDLVSIEYHDGEARTINLSSFNNHSLK